MSEATDDPRNTLLTRALQQIRTLRTELESARKRDREALAITGAACRLPGGVCSPEQFWELLAEGRDGFVEIPPSRWKARDFYDPDPEAPGKSNVSQAGFINDVDQFDAKFFGISPREAAWMDPQQRLFLEVAWEALERAGESPESVAGSRAGVFLGVTAADYTMQQMQRIPCEQLEAYYGMGWTSTFAAGRLSHWLGATGPSLSVDTSCSSSLVAVHLACQSLRAGECDLAIVGGTNLMLMPELFVVLTKAGMLSPDGRCKTFDKSADGYGRGEGTCVLVLKRVSDALRDRDRITALLTGSAVNHDGRSSGLTVPNAKAQSALITAALRDAGVAPASVGYLEAHGTGTPLGDPIEVQGITSALCQGRSAELAVASVKANIGHLEASAGIAGLLKTALVVERGWIPPHIGMTQLNPDVAAHCELVRFPTSLEKWSPPEGQTRIAGVSSLGACGTNAHVVVEQAPVLVEDGRTLERPAHLLVLSAMSEDALRHLAKTYATHLAASTQALADVCFTAATGRAHMPYRLAVVATSAAQATRSLDAFVEGKPDEFVSSGKASLTEPKVASLFTGQGSQYPGMGRELMATSPSFRADIERCDALCREHGVGGVREILEGTSGNPEEVHRTLFSQPALFAIEYALARMWMRWGVRPALILGHSIGEYAGACIAGALRLEDAIKLVCRRAALMESLPTGSMATAHASLGEVQALAGTLQHPVAIAAENAERLVTVSGSNGAIEAFVSAAKERGIDVQPMKVERAFHSHAVEPILTEFERFTATVDHAPLDITLISTLRAELIPEGTQLTPNYWSRQIREPVLFSKALALALRERPTALLEIGARSTLTKLVRAAAPAFADCALTSLSGKGADWQDLLTSLARLYVAGHRIDWRSVDEDYARRKVLLPTYPFERRRFWMEHEAPSARIPTSRGAARSATLAGRRLDLPVPGIHFELTLDAREHETLEDCVAHHRPIVNVGFYLEMMFAVADELDVTWPRQVRELIVRSALFMPESRSVRVCNSLVDEGSAWAFEVSAQDQAEPATWSRHVSGSVVRNPLPEATAAQPAALPPTHTATSTGADFYAQLETRGIRLGRSAQWIESVWREGDEAWCRFRAPRASERGRYNVHPGIADSIFQLCFTCLPSHVDSTAAYIVSEIRECLLKTQLDAPSWGHVRIHPSTGDGRVLTADLEVLQQGEVVLAIRNATVLRVDVSALHARPTSSGNSRPATREVHQLSLEKWASAEPAERVELAQAYLRERLAAVLRMSAADVVESDSFFDLGLDSLMAVELRDLIAAEAKVKVSLVDILQCPNLLQLASVLADRLRSREENVAPAAGGPGSASNESADGATALTVAAKDQAYAPFPLTDLQAAYLVGRTDMFELGNVATFGVFEFDVEGTDPARIEQALNASIARHEMLRARVSLDTMQQQVLEDVPWYSLPVTDLSGFDGDEREAALLAIRAEMHGAKRDAGSWPLMDIRITRTNPSRFRLHVGVDALVQDAKGTASFFADWARAYREDLRTLPALRVTFRDYILELKAREASGALDEHRAYWVGRLDTLPGAPQLPMVKSFAEVEKVRFRRLQASIERAKWEIFQVRARAMGVTPSMALCAAYARVLAAWSKESKFILNVLVFNRAHPNPDIEHVVANFSSTVLVEVEVNAQASHSALALAVQHQLWSDIEHSAFSGVLVLRELNRKRGASNGAGAPFVFTSTLPIRESHGAGQLRLTEALHALGDRVDTVYSSIHTPQVCLDHQAVENGGNLLLNWDVVDEVFPAGLMDEMFSAYVTFVECLIADERMWNRPRPLVLPAGMLAARARRNTTEAPRPIGLLHDAYEAQVAARPDALAVRVGAHSLRYGELDQYANAVARAIFAADVSQGSLVAIVMRKSWQQVAAALGCLKAGVAYLPIDLDLPGARIAQLLTSARVRLALIQKQLTPTAEWQGARQIVCVDELAPLKHVVQRRCAENELAYTIFTSGSTGQPKGVMIEHGAALNTVADISRKFSIGARDRVLGLSSLSFDLSVYDIFGVLGAGGALVLPDIDESADPAAWLRYLLDLDVTVWNAVPALLQLLVEYCEREQPDVRLRLRLVMMSGDWIPVSLPDRIRRIAPDAEIISLGGATEVSIWSVYRRIGAVSPSWRSIPYGAPLANQTCYVLNDAMLPCPNGVAGMLYIGGSGLARGYWDDPEKTAASFVIHPDSGERVYRTGDWARYLPDGELEFLGRQDGQVKINGFRVELGEIETAIRRTLLVESAVVIAAGERAESKRLVAFVTMAPGKTLSGAELESQLSRILPAYMVPRQYSTLAAIPLTQNGKVDRAALAAQAVRRQESTQEKRDEAPSPQEAKIIEILENALEKQGIGREDNFFELGGNSMLAIRVLRDIEHICHKKLRLGELIGNPSAAALAAVMQEKAAIRGDHSLIALTRGAAGRAKVVCVHPVGGGAFCYGGMAHALEDVLDVYGLQCPDFDSDVEVRSFSIEEVAADYLQRVDGLGPVQQLVLCGWSMGGVIAFEMARQLALAGRPVRELVMIDAPQYEEVGASISDAQLLAWFARDLAGLAGRTDEASGEGLASLESLVDWARNVGAVPAAMDVAPMRRFFAIFSRNARMLARYAPKAFDGHALLLQATDNPRSQADAERWRRLLKEPSPVHLLPGDHYSLMRNPRIARVAAAIRTVCGEPRQQREAARET